jgi:hypothetical protein
MRNNLPPRQPDTQDIPTVRTPWTYRLSYRGLWIGLSVAVSLAVWTVLGYWVVRMFYG